MGLFDFFKKLYQPTQEIRMLLLGLDNVGKTTILKRISNEEPVDIRPTQGFNVVSQILIVDKVN